MIFGSSSLGSSPLGALISDVGILLSGVASVTSVAPLTNSSTVTVGPLSLFGVEYYFGEDYYSEDYNTPTYYSCQTKLGTLTVTSNYAVALTSNVSSTSVNSFVPSINVDKALSGIQSNTSTATLNATATVQIAVGSNVVATVVNSISTSQIVNIQLASALSATSLGALSREIAKPLSGIVSTSYVNNLTNTSSVALLLNGNYTPLVAGNMTPPNVSVNLTGTVSVSILGSFYSAAAVLFAVLSDAQLNGITLALQNVNDLIDIDFTLILKAIDGAATSIQTSNTYSATTNNLISATITAIAVATATIDKSSIPVKSTLTDSLKSSIAALTGAKTKPALSDKLTNLAAAKSSTLSASILFAAYKPIVGNGKNVARLSDSCTGHGCFQSRMSVSASDDVVINNRGAHRVSDQWQEHTCVTTHGSYLEAGSSSVYVNGLPLGRVGDPIACGSFVASGSDDVFAGD